MIFVVLFFVLMILFAVRMVNYIYTAHNIKVKDLQTKIAERDKYISQLISELKYKQYEVDNKKQL